MKIILIVHVVVVFSFCSCSPKGFLSISKEVEKKCIGKKSNWKGESFHSLRTKLYNEGKLNFISYDFDTLYMLESYEIESGTYMGRIWNSRGTLNYTYDKNGFSFARQKLFTDFAVHLIQNWDTVAIKKEENVNANKLPEKYINATKVLVANMKAEIECIRFKEFFKLERDR